jgi:hypothetical protein
MRVHLIIVTGCRAKGYSIGVGSAWSASVCAGEVPDLEIAGAAKGDIRVGYDLECNSDRIGDMVRGGAAMDSVVFFAVSSVLFGSFVLLVH